MVTEANYQHWTESDQDRHFEAVLEAFGPNRLMFGTDWPVCLVATSYQAWFNLVRAKIAQLSTVERYRIPRRLGR